MNHHHSRFSKIFLFVLLCLFCLQLESVSRPNIVLITIDTLRADHLGCYGYKQNTSPNLDRFAKQSILFQNAYSAVPLTLPSHATILSGLYPKRHGIRDNAHFPLTDSPLVQQILNRNGYHTAAFISGSPLSSSFGLNRGFDYYDDEFSGTERKANETTLRVIQWMKEAKNPYFLWVHYFDPHADYEPPAEFRKRFPSPYDGEISFVDSEFGKLLQAMSPDSIVIVVADHGESLGEHGETTHAVFVYNATIRVPFLIRSPRVKAGVRAEAVSLIDITPTILDLAGIPAGVHLDGLSVFAEVKQRDLLAESLYAERNFGYAALYACIRSAGKYIQAPQPEFYDLQNDPAEKRNLVQQKKVTEWQAALKPYSKDDVSAAPTQAALSAEEMEKLRSLGYVSGVAKQTGVDPKSRIQLIENFRKAMVQLKNEQFTDAEKSFRQITASEKQNGLGFRFLGDALSAQQKYSEAVKAYSISIQELPDPAVSVQLAKAYNHVNQPERAEATLRDTIKRFPHYWEAIFELSSFYAEQQRWDQAFQLLDIDRPEFHNQRGALYLQQKQPQKAKEEFLLALKEQQKAFYWNNLGIANQRLQNVTEAENAFRQALKLNPDYEECEANLAFLYVAAKRWEDARTLLERVTLRNPELWRARFALGYVLENQGKTGEALQAYRKLLTEAPADWPERAQLQTRVEALSQ